MFNFWSPLLKGFDQQAFFFQSFLHNFIQIGQNLIHQASKRSELWALLGETFFIYLNYGIHTITKSKRYFWHKIYLSVKSFDASKLYRWCTHCVICVELVHKRVPVVQVIVDTVETCHIPVHFHPSWCVWQGENLCQGTNKFQVLQHI